MGWHAKTPIIRLHGSLIHARMRISPENAIGATAALIRMFLQLLGLLCTALCTATGQA